MVFQPKPSYTYSDIGLVPTEVSNQLSRDNVSTGTNFLGYSLSLPILLAPMETVVGSRMVTTMRMMLGGLCFSPRTGNKSYDYGEGSVMSVGTKDNFDFYNEPSVVCLDVANGFHVEVKRAIRQIKDKYPKVKVVTGNVASIEGFRYLYDCGADAVRVGIGGGSVCTTSLATGVGVGQASIVREIAEWKSLFHKYDTPLLIADGGIKHPGDVAKAIALGADVVMMGGIFAGCEESPGNTIEVNGKLYKQLSGQASHKVKDDNRYVEGVTKLVPYTGPVENTWKLFSEGLKSAMAYMNCSDIEGFKYLPDNCFTLLSDGAKAERHPHA